MKDQLMLDIETLGKTPDAPILSIAAVFFDIYTGETSEEFVRSLHIQPQLDAGAKVDASTVQWWMGQSAAAKSASFLFPEDIESALGDLIFFYDKFSGSETGVWGNGATFDNVILETTFRRHGLRAPWPFWASRDVRTLVSLDMCTGGKEKAEAAFKGTPHDPLDDAKHQIKYTSRIWRRIVDRASIG